MNKTKKRLTLTQRKVINVAVIIIAVLIIVGINILSTVLIDRFPSLEKDITGGGFYSLSDTTKEFLKYLEKEIKVTVLMSEDVFENKQDDMGYSDYYYQANKLLEQMSVYKKFNLEYKDITASSQSVLEKQYPDADWTSSNNLVLVEYGDKYEVLVDTDLFTYSYNSYYNSYYISSQSVEQEIVKAIQKITSDKTFKVAVSVGNGEILNESSQYYQSFNVILSLLDYNSYEVKNINLLTEDLTEDFDTLIMMVPYVDITNEQSEKINNWLINGGNYGKTFMYVPYEYNLDSIENTDLLLEQWGMKLQNGYVVEDDATMTAISGEAAGYAVYANDTYTEGLLNTNLSVYMPLAVGVEITDENMAKPLLTTSDNASLKIIGSETGETIKAEKPLNYAAIATKGNDDLSKASNIIVWGSCFSLGNDCMMMPNYNNAYYVLNMFDTAMGNDNESIVIQGTSLSVESITVSSAQKTGVLITFVFLIPALVLTLGIVVWVRRKNK